MATAKITIETMVDNKDLQDLNKNLAEGTKKLKEMQAQYREWSKDGKHTTEQMAELNTKIAAQKALNTQNSKSIRELANELAGAGDKAKGLKEQLSGMISDKLGVDFGSLTSMMTSSTAAMGAMVTAIGTVAVSLSNAGKEMSAYSNQFISYTKNMKSATEMYNLFNEVARNMNSSYNEQQIYNMAKGFMNVGISAGEAADLITKCTDAAASMGKGAEFADMLGDAFKRLATGGELTEKQYKALAEAGIDLTDVQEQMRKGGTAAYDALKKKLEEYEGGMASTKTTSEEMAADCSANLVEIGRQTAYLVDDFFGFSDALKTFYQWVIDTTGKVIESIKNMRNALRENMAAADEYARATQEWEATYGETFKGNDTERAAAMAAYANACADVAKEKAAEAIQEEKLLALESKREQVKSIAGGAKASGGGGGGGSSAKTTDPLKEYQDRANAISNAFSTSHAAMLKTQALQTKLTEASNQYYLTTLEGEAKEQIAFEQKQESIIRAQNLDNENTAAKIANLQEQMAIYQQAFEAGVPGSDAYIEKLQQTIDMENQQLSIRQQISDLMLQTAANQNAANGSAEKMSWSMQKMVDVGKQFGSALASWINGTKTLGQAMKDFAASLIQQAISIMAQWAAVFALVCAFKGPKVATTAANKAVLGIDAFATGGLVTGAGGPMSDTVPAMLSPGEIVMNASAVNAIGADNLLRANAAGVAAEGLGGGGGSVTLNVSTIDATGFSEFLGRGGLDSIKQALFDDDRNFASEVGVW